MNKKLMRATSIFLVIVLVLGMMPAALVSWPERASAATTLLAGDIAVLGLNADSTYPNQTWAFVPLVNISSGTVIHFTDDSFDGSKTGNQLFYGNTANEGHMTWTVPSDISAGTTFIVTNNSGGTATIKDINSNSYAGVSGSLGGNTSGFFGTGDQIIVYQGTDGTTDGATFIYALNTGQSGANYPTNGVWMTTGSVSAQGNSYLPTGLVNGTSAIALTSSSTSGSTTGGTFGFDNMKYNGTTSGTKAEILAAIGNPSNWVGDNTNTYNFSQIGNFSITGSNATPTASNVSVSGTAQVGQTLTGTYDYSDVNGDAQGTSTFKWYRSDDTSGTNKTEINGATANTYVLQAADLGKYISFEVTPVAAAGPSPGSAAESTKTGAVVPAPDTTAPTVNAYSPADETTNVAIGGNLELTFSENVTAVTGKTIVIKQASDDSTVATIAANDTTQVTVSGSTVTINPTADLSYSTGYYVQIDSGAFKDGANNLYAGIADTTAWNFTTEAAPTYTVSFNSNGGTVVTSQTVNYNETAIEPTAPTKTGYTFGGWYTDEALMSEFNFSIAITADTMLYAKWTAEPSTVSFNSNGGSSVDSQTVDYNTTATPPAAPTKTGYSFDGWYSDEALTSAFNFSAAITADTMLNAKWTINQYTVSFNSNGGTAVTSQTVTYNETATEPTAPTRTGYTFEGWYTDEVLTSEFNFTTAITANVTLYAHWKAKHNTTTTLTTSDNLVGAGESVTLTATIEESGEKTPTGTVTFKSGTEELATVTLDINAQATYTTSTLPAGASVITAEYSGDTYFLGSVSEAITQNIYVKLWMPHATGRAGEEVKVTVKFSSTGDVTGLQFDLSFDPNLLTLQDADPGLLLNGASMDFDYHQLGDGNYRFVIANVENINISQGTSELLELTFTINDAAVYQQKTALTLIDPVMVNSKEQNITEQFDKEHGSFTVIDDQAPTVELGASPSGLTNQTVTIAVYASGTGSNVKVKKWAKGNYSVTDFVYNNIGTELLGDSFNVDESGTYTVYVEDEAGNSNSDQIEVSIDKVEPAINFGLIPSAVDASVTAAVDADGTGSAVSEMKMLEGIKSLADFAGNAGASDVTFTTDGNHAVGQFEILKNAAYTVYVKDAAGNETIMTVYVMGDINFNQAVDVTDWVEIVNYILEKSVPSAAQNLVADMNTDNKLNVIDPVIVANIIIQGGHAQYYANK